MTDKVKIFVVIGTRPDTIKLAPVIFELKSRSNVFCTVCSSGQHKEMLEQATGIFDIEPDLNLDAMIPGQSLESLSARLIGLFSKSLETIQPDYVMVHGDTTTAFCAALAAFYKEISVIHVEAGLRTHNIKEPFPEEFNRQAIARIAKLHFAPTYNAKVNLELEGVNPEKIVVSGNTIVEALNLVRKKISEDSVIVERVSNVLNEILDFDYRHSPYVLITMHRRENIGEGIQQVCTSIAKLAQSFPNFKFVFPVHLNPSVGNDVKSILSGLKNVFLVSPLAYTEFVALLTHSVLVITDSGGIQEESVSLGKRVLVTRKITEREEGVESGLLKIVSTDSDAIFEFASRILKNPTPDKIPKINPFGEGNISKRIVDKILGT